MGSDIAALCSEAAMQQIRKKMGFIDLDEDTIDAEVLDSLGVTMENFRFALGCSNPSALRETVVRCRKSNGTTLVVSRKSSRSSRKRSNTLSSTPKFIKYGMPPSKGVLIYGSLGAE